MYNVKHCDHLVPEKGAGNFAFLCLCTVCHNLCAFPFGITVRLCSVTEAIPGHLLYDFFFVFICILISTKNIEIAIWLNVEKL